MQSKDKECTDMKTCNDPRSGAAMFWSDLVLNCMPQRMVVGRAREIC